MWIFWLIVMWLSPTAGCLLFVYVTPHPDAITAALGAIFGLALAVMALFVLT